MTSINMFPAKSLRAGDIAKIAYDVVGKRAFLPANPSQVKKELRTQSALYHKICMLGHSVLLQQKVSHVCQTSCYRKNYYGQICEQFLSYLLE